MGKCHKGGPRSRDREKYLVADNGKTYSVSTILACEQIGDRCCRAIIHKGGMTTFSGRAFDRMPPIKFNHCTSKFFGELRNGNHQLVAKATGDSAGAGGPVGARSFEAAKSQRAVYFEQPVAATRVAAADGGAAADMAEPSGPSDGATSELLDVVGARDAYLDRGPCGGSSGSDHPSGSANDGAGAPGMMMLGMKSSKEAAMTEKRNLHARRFSNAKHGRMLLEEVRVFMRQRGLVKMDGHWEEFESYAANRKTLKHWSGDQVGWDVRHRVAMHRWEGDQAQAEQVERVKDLLKKNEMTLGKIYDVINPEKPSRAKEQLSLRRSWDVDSLRNLAQFFDVSEEYLRTGETRPVAPPVSKQQQLPVPPWTPARAEVKATVRDEVPEQDARSRWDVERACEVLDDMAQLEKAGKGVNSEALAAYLDHARARRPISDLTESILAGTFRG